MGSARLFRRILVVAVVALVGAIAVPGTSFAIPGAPFDIHAVYISNSAVGVGTPASANAHVVSPATPLPASTRLRIWQSQDKCIDDPNYSSANGTWLDQWTCVDQTNERWYFFYAGTDPFNGDYYWIKNKASGLCMNIEGASRDDGAHVIQWPCAWNTNEYFWPKTLPDNAYGYFVLMNVNSYRCVSVVDASKANGAKLEQWGCGTGGRPNENIESYY